jgi:hypothetical protein
VLLQRDHRHRLQDMLRAGELARGNVDTPRARGDSRT